MPSTFTSAMIAAAVGALAFVAPAAAAGDVGSGAPFVAVPFNGCGSFKDHISQVAVSASSWPPRAGSDTILRVSGSLDGDVSAGSYKISARHQGDSSFSTSGDLSTFVDLPAAAGSVTIGTTLTLPASSPTGPYFLTLEFDSDSGESLTCVDVKFIVSQERPTVQSVDLSSGEAVLKPILDAGSAADRVAFAKAHQRLVLANHIADSMNGDIPLPRITVDASQSTDKDAGTITVSQDDAPIA